MTNKQFSPKLSVVFAMFWAGFAGVQLGTFICDQKHDQSHLWIDGVLVFGWAILAFLQLWRGWDVIPDTAQSVAPWKLLVQKFKRH